MNFQDLVEAPSFGNTFMTTAKALGSRVRDAAIASSNSAVGRHEARGRLTTRIMADRLMNAWLTFKGSTQQPPTRQNVYKWLSQVAKHQITTVLGDKMLRAITGMPEAPPSAPVEAKPEVHGWDEQMAAHLKSLHDGIVAELTP